MILTWGIKPQNSIKAESTLVSNGISPGEKNAVSKYVNPSGVLYEEIYIPEKKVARFVYWNDLQKKFLPVDSIIVGEFRYVPIFDMAVQKKAVLLPTHPEPYVSLESLTKEINEHVSKVWSKLSINSLQPSLLNRTKVVVLNHHT